MDESELSRADVAVFFSRFPKCTKMYIDGKKNYNLFPKLGNFTLLRVSFNWENSLKILATRLPLHLSFR